MAAYNFVQLDPRPGAQNPEIDFGIEVTMPGFRNDLDHHRPGDNAETSSACEQALSCGLPSEGAVIGTVRPDADSITAMAVLESRMTDRRIDIDLVNAIGLMDRYGPRVEADLVGKNLVIAIARVATDFKRSLEDRVAFVQSCLDGTFSMYDVDKLVEARNAEFAAAEAASEITVVIPGKLVFVKSTHRFATTIGYRYAPTVVAFNPEMAVTAKDPATGKFAPTGETYAKFTLCRYDDHVPTDLQAAVNRLREMELSVNPAAAKNNWGGRGDIWGSPQNTDSLLTPAQVIAQVVMEVK